MDTATTSGGSCRGIFGIKIRARREEVRAVIAVESVRVANPAPDVALHSTRRLKCWLMRDKSTRDARTLQFKKAYNCMYCLYIDLVLTLISILFRAEGRALLCLSVLFNIFDNVSVSVLYLRWQIKLILLLLIIITNNKRFIDRSRLFGRRARFQSRVPLKTISVLKLMLSKLLSVYLNKTFQN